MELVFFNILKLIINMHVIAGVCKKTKKGITQDFWNNLKSCKLIVLKYFDIVHWFLKFADNRSQVKQYLQCTFQRIHDF